VLDEAEVQAVHNKVRQLAVEGDRREAKVPPSVGRLGAAAVATIAIGMSSFIIPAYATRAGRLAFAASALAAIVAGWQARRRLPSPVFGAAAITGALGSVAVVALSYLL
jgi:hypothetical protein